MKIKLTMVKCGCSVGEVVIDNCDNFCKMIPDIVLTCFNIRDGFGYDHNQVAQEWCGISLALYNFIAEVRKGGDVAPDIFYDLQHKPDSFVQFTLY